MGNAVVMKLPRVGLHLDLTLRRFVPLPDTRAFPRHLPQGGY